MFLYLNTNLIQIKSRTRTFPETATRSLRPRRTYCNSPIYILRIYSVAKLDSDQLKEVLLEDLVVVTNAGGSIISCVGNNCKTNVAVYGKLGGPGKAFINAINSHIFLVFDYVHSFKTVRNNWITVPDKKLSFIKEGKIYVAR